MNKILQKTKLVQMENTHYFEGYRSGSMKGIDTKVSNILVNTYNYIIDTYKLDDFCDIFNALNYFGEIDESIEEKVSKMPIKIREAYYLAKHYYDEAKKEGSSWWKVDDVYFNEQPFGNFGFNSAGASFINSLFNLEEIADEGRERNTYNYDSALDSTIQYIDDLEVGVDEDENEDVYEDYGTFLGNVYTLLSLHCGEGDVRGNYHNYFMVSKNNFYIDEDRINWDTQNESMVADIEFKDDGSSLVKSIIDKTDAEELDDGICVIKLDNFYDFDWDKDFVKRYKLTEEEFEFLKTNSEFYC